MANKKTHNLIVALDVDTLEEVRVLVEKLDDLVDVFKVGSQLFTACGPAAVRFLLAKEKKVFLDLKYHDIPNTVYHAVEAAVNLSVAVERTSALVKKTNKTKENGLKPGLFMLTVHTLGGEEMMRKAVEAGIKASQNIGFVKPLIVGITVLTSEEKNDNILHLVLERASLAKRCGLDGVVASSQEAQHIRKKFGGDFLIITPGIRPKEEDAGDQKRMTTPKEAIDNGSNFLVVGRPIVQAKDPYQATQKILEEIY